MCVSQNEICKSQFVFLTVTLNENDCTNYLTNNWFRIVQMGWWQRDAGLDALSIVLLLLWRRRAASYCPKRSLKVDMASAEAQNQCGLLQAPKNKGNPCSNRYWL